jgi:hypothetical protein
MLMISAKPSHGGIFGFLVVEHQRVQNGDQFLKRAYMAKLLQPASTRSSSRHLLQNIEIVDKVQHFTACLAHRKGRK